MDRILLMNIKGLVQRFSTSGLSNRAKPQTSDWPETLSGVSYAPFRSGQDPGKNLYPSRAQIEEDLELIRPLTRNVRTYSVKGTLACIPEVAQALDMTVTLGAWISQDEKSNEAELAVAIDLTNGHANVDRLLVGSEVLYRGDVLFAQLLDYMKRARSQTNVPIATSEVWSQWIDTPELAQHSDFIAAHVLPFWERIPVHEAIFEVMARADQLRRMFPDKPIVLAEVGWPGKSNAARRIFTSPTEQSTYLRNQLQRLDQQGYAYFVIEAFDQQWKTDEGPQGPHWGVFNTRRKRKTSLSSPVQRPARWRAHCRNMTTRLRTECRWCLIAVITFTYGLLAAAGLTGSTSLSIWIALPLSLTWASSLLTSIGIEAHEVLEACYGTEHPRTFAPKRLDEHYAPGVSIHVPCYNEPPDMVKRSLDALARLDYPDFEVLVVDNNTCDPEVWKPVERHCLDLGTRFKFFHVNPLPGFKAGALNYLVDHTAADAEIVAVIDADYCVNHLWLRHMVPHFADPLIGVIQLPQDYRDGRDSLFKRCCEAEYRGFFNIGMVVRNDHNAIIQHGTMTMIRRTVLQKLRWAEWSISEDAELGLRVLENNFSAGYHPGSYGKGLIPDTFTDFKKQRYRWAYGAVQIFKHHFESLVTGKTASLNAIQRYHYLAGWLPWAAEGINYLLTLIVLSWTASMMLAPQVFGPLPWIFSISLLLMFVLRITKVIFLYRQLISADIREALAAILAGMALYPTIGKAVVLGALTSRLPFFRTPKQTTGSHYGQALFEVSDELWILLLYWLAAIGLCFSDVTADIDLWSWIAMLLVKSLPYLAAVVMAVLSARAARTTGTTT
ncbi:glycosyltransferase family 2 protein [Pseudomonas viridiflava]|uniref:glycosyltransferase family 2 protein n=1 Tax=Pseudomonas viridiflava TaxID=33069 RepID=UPI000C08DF9C|nr:glycosyltransferase family 2 protein [Pseudomonas viridiflava]MEE4915544.1 glycosyltransferase family 2 protein [Pseudomonas alliivorans]PHN56615.1 beta-(1-3)-glucosyl transferase [Pseudomonas viridiflava]